MRTVRLFIFVCSIILSLSFNVLINNPDKDKLLIEVIPRKLTTPFLRMYLETILMK